jgi:hypothetical protein
VSRVEQHSNGIPVLMSAPAATAGFRALEAERIALIHAPFFTEDFDQKGVAYLTSFPLALTGTTERQPAQARSPAPTPAAHPSQSPAPAALLGS